VSSGDRVTVRVLEVKLDRKQIALTMKTARGADEPARARDEQPSGPRGGGGDRRGGGPGAPGQREPARRGPGPAPSNRPAAPPPRTPFNNPFAGLDKLRRS